MAQLLVMYHTPADPAAFDRYYTETHIPLVHKIPGLRKFEITHGPIATPFGPSPYHLLATLHFDDLATLHASFATPEGRAAGADAQTFMSPKDQLLIFENQEA
jgi:uncharacterized protein (TIGR02118 family)